MQYIADVAVTVEGEDLRVTFPYDEALVARLRSVPSRRWDAEKKSWYVPKHQWRILKEVLGDYPLRMDFNPKDLELKKPVPIEAVKGFNATLYPFQAEAVGFLLTRKQCLLADEMGLGKTICAVATSIELRNRGLVKKVLVLCPKTIIAQWAGEILRFTGEKTSIISGGGEERNQAYIKAGFWVITNYETVLRDAEKLAGLNPDIVVLDEAQRIGSYNSQTTTQIKAFLKPEYRWALTGTPIENGLEELHSIMQWVNSSILEPWYLFKNRYLVYGGYKGKQVVGSKNLQGLHSQIRDWMLRRHKRDVLKDLPSVTVNNYYVELGRDERKTYSIIRKDLEKYYRLFRASRERQGSGEVLAQLTYLRECCDSQALIRSENYLRNNGLKESSKLDELTKILGDIGDEKVVVFTEYERMLHFIASMLKGVGYESLYGALNNQQRVAAIETFTKDPECRVFLSTEAGGLGVNLQAASVLINFELHWNPARLQQRIGRLHRIGQKNTVTCINLVARDTIEEKVLDVINDKSDLFRNVVDGDFSSIDHERAVWKILSAEFHESPWNVEVLPR